jgi:hypothetical protein
MAASGDEKEALYCVRRAVALCPNSALVLLRAANVIFRTGESVEALHLLARILRLTAELDQIVFSTFERLGGGTEAVLKSGMPADSRAGQSFLRYLITNKRNPVDIHKTWDWLERRALTDRRVSVDYVNYLVASRQFDAAATLWFRLAGPARADYMHPNLVFNGDFESDPSGVVLDWQIAPSEGVQVNLPSNEGHTGSRALRLDFDAQQNIAFNQVHEDVIVGPGRYRFEFFVKSDNITTDQGAGFHLFDAEAPGRLDITVEPAVGTKAWERQTAGFAVPPGTRLLRMELRRQPSGKFDNKITGTLWIDSVKLYPVS